MLRAADSHIAGWPSLRSGSGPVFGRPAQIAMMSALRAPGLRGLGATTEQNIMSSVQIAGATVSTAAGLGAGWATAAIPIVGPVIAGVTIGLSLLFARKGPKQKVATTSIVNAVEPELKKNLDGYLNGPRTKSSQAQALANFDAGWQYVVEHCDIPEMGAPGKRCVSDRVRGGQWPWPVYYRDPIANDPDVKPDPSISDSLVQTLFGSSSSSAATPGAATAAGAAAGSSSLDLGGLLIPAGLLLLLVVM